METILVVLSGVTLVLGICVIKIYSYLKEYVKEDNRVNG